MKTVFTLVMCILIIIGCKKSLTMDSEVVPSEQEFRKFLTVSEKKFTLSAFYASKPIDYDPYDSVYIKETDLWRFAAWYLKDDKYVFNESTQTVTLYQDTVRHPTITADSLVRPYGVKTLPEGGVMFDFVDQNYESYQYRLAEMGQDYFIVYVDRDSVKLYSRYQAR